MGQIKNILTNFYLSLCALIPFTVTISTSCNSNSQSLITDTNDDEASDLINADDFFPELFASDYYSYVEFDNNAKPIIGDKFIYKVVEDVVDRVATSKGTIRFSIDRYSSSSIDINFEWRYQEKVLYKTYSFEIKE